MAGLHTPQHGHTELWWQGTANTTWPCVGCHWSDVCAKASLAHCLLCSRFQCQGVLPGAESIPGGRAHQLLWRSLFRAQCSVRGAVRNSACGASPLSEGCGSCPKNRHGAGGFSPSPLVQGVHHQGEHGLGRAPSGRTRTRARTAVSRHESILVGHSFGRGWAAKPH